jgi:hypothetical protein
MELAIRPEDLHAASVALTSCRANLEDAALSFARRAQAELPDVGANAAEAAGRGVASTERAVQILCSDLDRLARALAELAHHYPRVDTTAVPHR